MNHIEENPEDKELLSWIMKIYTLECPIKNCVNKTKVKLY